MDVAEVLQNVDGLTFDGLTRLVQTGLIRPKGARWNSLVDAQFSNTDLFLIKRTWNYMRELRRQEPTAS